ncbi:MAG: glucosyl-3-phosphoglycerate synthase [Actinomycetota bacterium]|nr:glucosyl-3-phosphoglycerate synthase [Actinomycetota bacterium]
MSAIRTVHHRDFTAAALVEVKGQRRVTVCLPARDEEETVGAIVASIGRALVQRAPLVDEVLVVDDGSHDGTAAAAAAAGARVVATAAVGKGRAMWTGLRRSRGDVVVFCDADVRNFAPSFVVGLLGPVLSGDDTGFVKAFYDRPLDGRAGEGGRVTELLAKPLLRTLFPQLAPVVQPLAGECAGRREVFEQVPFAEGYGVDIALLLDVVSRFGLGAVAQVDLGERVHRNRPIHELVPQADAVLRTALSRAGLAGPVPQCPRVADVAGAVRL